MPVRSAQIALAAVLAVLAAVLPGAAGAAPGDLDPTFGSGGIVTTSFGGGGAEAYAVAILPNWKIVVAGAAGGDFALARYLPDGALDPVLDGDGKVTTDFAGSGDGAYGLAIQSNGRIVAVGGGGADFALARYKRDGGLDLTFGATGKVMTDLGAAEGETAADVALQPDGKIVVVGTRDLGPNDEPPGVVGDFAVVRYHPDGSLDAGFGYGGVVLTALTELGGEATAVALQDDGRIVVAGYVYSPELTTGVDLAVVRYDADGTLDTSFDGDGIVLRDLGNSASEYATDLAIQSDGKIVVAGRHDGDLLLARFNPDGSLETQGLDPYLDAPFGVGGQVTTDFGGFDYASAVAIESGGKLVAAGEMRLETAENYSDFALARYNVDGSLDQTFGADGKVTTDLSDDWDAMSDIALQRDGSIVAVGRASIDGVRQFVVARYLAAPCCGFPGGIGGP